MKFRLLGRITELCLAKFLRALDGCSNYGVICHDVAAKSNAAQSNEPTNTSQKCEPIVMATTRGRNRNHKK